MKGAFILLRGIMLGPIGSEIMSIFRLLSPDEIDKYIVEEKADESIAKGSIKIAVGGESLGLTSAETHQGSTGAGTKFPKDHQAKIIPLHGRSPEEEDLLDKSIPEKKSEQNNSQREDDHHGQERPQNQARKHSLKASTGSSLDSIGILSASQIRNIENERLENENKKRDSSTVFLLKERERMRSAKRKLIEQVAIKSYQVNASQEFYEKTDGDFEDEELDDLKGILLNKRHY